jgi:hypothetical protein
MTRHRKFQFPRVRKLGKGKAKDKVILVLKDHILETHWEHEGKPPSILILNHNIKDHKLTFYVLVYLSEVNNC